VPSGRCRVLVSRRSHSARTLLIVAGTSLGPAQIQLRYQQPDSDAWLTARLSLNIVAERALPIMTLGSKVPQRAARLDHLSPALQSAGFRLPVRCEADSEWRTSYVCFGPDTSTGVPRFPSCESTSRCARGHRAPKGGFRLDIDWHDGVISQIDYHARFELDRDVTERWQLSDSAR
jgi:hypothetical protein